MIKTANIIRFCKGGENVSIDFGKRMGMGGLRLPVKDPANPMSIDMWTISWTTASIILILLIFITENSPKTHTERLSWTDTRGIPSCFPQKCL